MIFNLQNIRDKENFDGFVLLANIEIFIDESQKKNKAKSGGRIHDMEMACRTLLRNGILLPKLFPSTVEKNYSSDQENS